MLSEKRLIEEKVDMFEQQNINAYGDGLKRDKLDNLSFSSYPENRCIPKGVKSVSLLLYSRTNKHRKCI